STLTAASCGTGLGGGLSSPFLQPVAITTTATSARTPRTYTMYDVLHARRTCGLGRALHRRDRGRTEADSGRGRAQATRRQQPRLRPPRAPRDADLGHPVLRSQAPPGDRRLDPRAGAIRDVRTARRPRARPPVPDAGARLVHPAFPCTVRR